MATKAIKYGSIAILALFMFLLLISAVANPNVKDDGTKLFSSFGTHRSDFTDIDKARAEVNRKRLQRQGLKCNKVEWMHWSAHSVDLLCDGRVSRYRIDMPADKQELEFFVYSH